MPSQVRVVQEYRALLDELMRQLPEHPLLQKLQMGWLTPGSEILRRLEKEKTFAQTLLQTSQSLHRKWFDDLSDSQKGRWVSILRPLCVHGEMEEILQLTLRRLQQLQRKTKCISRGTVSFDQESSNPPKVSGDVHEAQSLKNRSSARIARRTLGG